MSMNLRFGWIAALTGGLVGIAVAAGAWPTWRLAGWPGLGAMVGAAAATVLGSLASLLIIAKGAQADAGKLAMTFLWTAPVRLIVTLLAAGGAWWVGRWPVTAFLLWVAMFYMLFLAAEAAWLTRILRAK